MGGRTWAPEVRPELPEAQFTYDERASRPLNLDLPMGLREAYMPRERFPGRELPDASDPLRGIGPQPPYNTGGSVSDAPVAGPMLGTTGGREDALPRKVKSGTYVLPSDFVAALGDGNTNSGFQVIEQTFGKPSTQTFAAGGAAQDVDILISDGEYALSPDQVAKIGGGDPDKGNQILDKLVLQVRQQHIAKLKSLPAPARP